MLLSISRAALVRLRKRLGLTHTELAERSGVSLRTVVRLETSPTLVKLATVERLAAALGTTPDRLLPPARDDGKKPLPAPSLPPARAQARTPRHGHESLRETLRSIPIPQSILDEAARQDPASHDSQPDACVLGARQYQDISAAFHLHAQAIFRASGEVSASRAIGALEARELTTRPGIGARFVLVRAIGPGVPPLRISFHTRLPEHTRELQKLRFQQVNLTLRVLVAKDDLDVFGCVDDDSQRPWTLVVESIEAASPRRA